MVGEAENVQQQPGQHQYRLQDQERPAPDQAREVVAYPLRSAKPPVGFLVQVANRGMIMLMANQRPVDVLDLSPYCHLYPKLKVSGVRIALLKFHLDGYER